MSHSQGCFVWIAKDIRKHCICYSFPISLFLDFSALPIQSFLFLFISLAGRKASNNGGAFLSPNISVIVVNSFHVGTHPALWCQPIHPHIQNLCQTDIRENGNNVSSDCDWLSMSCWMFYFIAWHNCWTILLRRLRFLLLVTNVREKRIEMIARISRKAALNIPPIHSVTGDVDQRQLPSHWLL